MKCPLCESATSIYSKRVGNVRRFKCLNETCGNKFTAEIGANVVRPATGQITPPPYRTGFRWMNASTA